MGPPNHNTPPIVVPAGHVQLRGPNFVIATTLRNAASPRTVNLLCVFYRTYIQGKLYFFFLMTHICVTKLTAPAKYMSSHDDVIRWKHFPRYWPLWEIHWSPVNSPHKGQQCGTLMRSLMRSYWSHYKWNYSNIFRIQHQFYTLVHLNALNILFW